MDLELVRELARPSGRRIVLVVVDGLVEGPVLEDLARRGTHGMHEPGGSPLALLGYDPRRYRLGDGVLAALEIGFPLGERDIAFRGRVVDGDTDLSPVAMDDVQVHVRPLGGTDFLLVLRGEGLGADVADTVPGEQRPRARDSASRRTAELVERLMAGREVVLRGASRLPAWPRLTEVAQLRAECRAGQPMVQGLARIVGMEVSPEAGDPSSRIALALEDPDVALTLVHLDAAEAHDRALAPLLDCTEDVIVVMGDGPEPAPVVLVAPTAPPGTGFGPSLPAHAILPLAMHHAGRLARIGG